MICEPYMGAVLIVGLSFDYYPHYPLPKQYIDWMRYALSMKDTLNISKKFHLDGPITVAIVISFEIWIISHLFHTKSLTLCASKRQKCFPTSACPINSSTVIIKRLGILHIQSTRNLNARTPAHLYVLKLWFWKGHPFEMFHLHKAFGLTATKHHKDWNFSQLSVCLQNMITIFRIFMAMSIQKDYNHYSILVTTHRAKSNHQIHHRIFLGWKWCNVSPW